MTFEQIEHKGKMVHVTDSEGRRIHPTDEGVKKFHDWFGNSKAVDEHGRPKVYYHGGKGDIKAFSHEFSGKGVDEHGSGFYFTDKPHVANMYASDKESGSVTPVYLKVKKPLHKHVHRSNDDSGFSPAQIQHMIHNSPVRDESLENYGDVSREGYHKVLRGAVNSYVGSSKLDTMHMLHNDFYQDHHEAFLKNFTDATGHDAVSVHGQGDGHIYNVFHPSQIKSALGNSGKFSKKTDNLHESEPKSFDDFLAEATLADREFRNKRQASKKNGSRAHMEKSSAALQALKHAHSAKLKGDETRHQYWLKRAYAKLTGK